MKALKAVCGSQMRPIAFISAFVVLATQAFGGCVSTTEVREIYPTATVLPANLLRVYIYFSAPMQQNTALEHIVLKDADGHTVPDAFLPTRYALWSPDRTRLTLMLDPGRVKTGLDAHDAKGRALEAGQLYSLVVQHGLMDQSGCSLKSSFEKAFEAGVEDFEVPTPSEWSFAVPRSGSKDPLRVTLNGSHDHVSLAYGLRVRSFDGNIVPGRIGVFDGESTWVFHPAEDWDASRYTISIDEKFEDLAGNRTTGLFDDPTGQARMQQQNGGHKELNFTVR